ncbi:MAG: hypothetical protein K0Q74_1498 [Gammaproteobacteria bacterium]|nr:hypothetical protein [Gammaproteobacteria bacterium]
MLEQQTPIRSLVSSELMVPRPALQRVEADKALIEFLAKIKRMQTEKRTVSFETDRVTTPTYVGSSIHPSRERIQKSGGIHIEGLEAVASGNLDVGNKTTFGH